LTAGELASTQVLAPQDQSVATARVGLTAGRSTVLTVDFDITRIALTNPAVADATVVEPREILIDGKAPGTVTMILWGADRRVQYDVVVDPPVSAIQQQLRNLFPGEDINVTVQDEATTLSGRVSSTAVMLKAAEIAQITSSKTKVINLLQVPGGGQSDQVLLQVRFAEVNARRCWTPGSIFSPVRTATRIGSCASRPTPRRRPSRPFRPPRSRWATSSTSSRSTPSTTSAR
jgi:pilus assembly protein CpaC